MHTDRKGQEKQHKCEEGERGGDKNASLEHTDRAFENVQLKRWFLLLVFINQQSLSAECNDQVPSIS